MNDKDSLIPQLAVIKEVRRDTPDVKTFRVVDPNGGKPFTHIPGQCAFLSIPGVGEAIFSITSSPTEKDFIDFSIKEVGKLTTILHSLKAGSKITIRGPYGNGFPVETEFKKKNLVFIAGGIGLAPLHSVINYCRALPENYGKLDIVYGSRSKADLVDIKEIEEEWMKDKNINVHLTIDREEEGWDGHVGFVPDFVRELGLDTSYTAVVCGPPIMIKFTLKALKDLGFEDNQIFTTLEMRMKCGIGKCGRCNVGKVYVCKDGPVFSWDQLGILPEEY